MIFDAAIQRRAVIAEAMTWLATPFHHRQSVKGAGADCAMFPWAVYRNAGVDVNVVIPEYPMQWHLHRSEELYLQTVEKIIQKIGGSEVSAAQPADFVVFKIGRTFSHGAIVLDWPKVIHSSLGAGCVELHDCERSELMRAPRKFFSPWQVA